MILEEEVGEWTELRNAAQQIICENLLLTLFLQVHAQFLFDEWLELGKSTVSSAFRILKYRCMEVPNLWAFAQILLYSINYSFLDINMYIMQSFISVNLSYVSKETFLLELLTAPQVTLSSIL